MPVGKWVRAPGGDQAQPSCFGVGQLRIPERPEDERLCSACMSLGHLDSTHWDAINNFRKVIVNHHDSFDALLKSAREGCHLCGLLLAAWEQECRLEQEPGGGWVGKEGQTSASLNGIIRLKFQRVQTTFRPTGTELDEVQITILCGDLLSSMGGRLICKPMNNDHRALPKACLPSGSDTDTGSSASMSRIRAWLDICTSSHPACSQADSQPRPLPTRLIAVGKKGSGKCHLVSGNEKSGHYATLSHCWGDPNNRPLSTTDQTLPCRQRGIEDESLPRTFRDAVQVCRELNIDYIWIDSLCIIQEQETQEDWTKEAPKMGDVYGNSMLNISAAAAEDSTQGCFKERFGLFSWPCPIVLFGQTCYLFRYPMRLEEFYGNPGDLGNESANVLGGRAWVLQEQILSRRSIVFSNTCLIWHCPMLSTNEKHPLGIPHAPSTSIDNRRLFHCIVNGITSCIPKGPPVDIYTCWYRTVRDFTFRDLTYEEDRLPAIAGIAKKLRVVVNDSYHAGLWRHDMIRGLLWMSRGHTVRTTDWTKIRSARAPSWSWASINCGVSYLDILSTRDDASLEPFSPLLHIVDVSDPITCQDHPVGVLSTASLSLSGVLLAVIQEEHEALRLSLVNNGTRSAHEVGVLIPDVWDPDRPCLAPLVCLPVSVHHRSYRLGATHNDELIKASWQRSLETGIDEFEGFNDLHCLILQAIGGKQDTYRRVGLCIVDRCKTIDITRMALIGERRSITIV